MPMYYLQTNILCIFIVLIIYISMRKRNDAVPARRRIFNRLLLIIGVISVADIFAWYFNGQSIPGAKGILQVSNIIYDAAITWAGYAWLNYVNLRVRSTDYKHEKSKRVLSIPLIIMILLLVTNPFTGWLFTIDETITYARANGIAVHWIISWFYLLYATIVVFKVIREASSRAEKEQYLPMLWFIVPPVLAAIVQMLIYGATTTQCGMALSALIIAINFIVDEVSKDTLTGLNNRRALEITIIERLQKSNSKITVLMCDVDKFKNINDTLGHTAGDWVLKGMASALKSVCTIGNKRLFLCRYGGDEFVICGSDMTKEEIEQLKTNIENAIATVNKDYSEDLKFGISIGEATGNCLTYEDVEALISLADGRMYEHKQSKK